MLQKYTKMKMSLKKYPIKIFHIAFTRQQESKADSSILQADSTGLVTLALGEL